MNDYIIATGYLIAAIALGVAIGWLTSTISIRRMQKKEFEKPSEYKIVPMDKRFSTVIGF